MSVKKFRRFYVVMIERFRLYFLQGVDVAGTLT